MDKLNFEPYFENTEIKYYEPKYIITILLLLFIMLMN